MDLDKYFKEILEDIKQNKIVKPKVNKLWKRKKDSYYGKIQKNN